MPEPELGSGVRQSRLIAQRVRGRRSSEYATTCCRCTYELLQDGWWMFCRPEPVVASLSASLESTANGSGRTDRRPTISTGMGAMSHPSKKEGTVRCSTLRLTETAPVRVSRRSAGFPSRGRDHGQVCDATPRYRVRMARVDATPLLFANAIPTFSNAANCCMCYGRIQMHDRERIKFSRKAICSQAK